MHILPRSWREKLEDAGLNPAATDEEAALWATEEKAVTRRTRYIAAAKAVGVMAIAGAVKFIRHPDMSTSKALITLGAGVAFTVVLFGFFLLQARTDKMNERVKFIQARRMHRAILDEPDLDADL